MDFSKYLKGATKKEYGITIRKCLECGKDVEKSDSHLYLHSFCSQDCKNKYIGRDSEF